MKIVARALVAGLGAVLLGGVATPAHAAGTGPVSQTPASWTPSLATSGTDGTVEKVRQFVPCGGMMYAVGTFTQIAQGGSTYARKNAFSFSATTGAVSAWNPNVTGSVVNSIALSSDCSVAYLGGHFSAVHGQAATNIAAVSTATGGLIGTFRHSANGQVAALLRVGSHLLVGGYFTSINGSSKRYMVSLNTSGVDDGFVNLNISGNYQYIDAGGKKSAANATRVWNYSRSPDGTKLLVMGDFTSVGGVGRRQMFMLNLATTPASVTSWYPTEFNQNCQVSYPYWLRDASWSPDGSKIFIAATGYKPATGSGYYTANPRTGLCDSVAAFPASGTNVSHLWINYTGCDSLYSTAADASTVYVGGHERWANNGSGCNKPGSGAVSAPGMGGFNPSTGQLSFNPTRGRGEGADDEVLTSAGLWIASDNAHGANRCGKTSSGTPVYGHAGICFLPY